jgi:hypothetical protein
MFSMILSLFLKAIKLIGSNLFLRSLTDEHKNEFT